MWCQDPYRSNHVKWGHWVGCDPVWLVALRKGNQTRRHTKKEDCEATGSEGPPAGLREGPGTGASIPVPCRSPPSMPPFQPQALEAGRRHCLSFRPRMCSPLREPWQTDAAPAFIRIIYQMRMGWADYPVTSELLCSVCFAGFWFPAQIFFSHFPLRALKPFEYNQQQHLFLRNSWCPSIKEMFKNPQLLRLIFKIDLDNLKQYSFRLEAMRQKSRIPGRQEGCFSTGRGPVPWAGGEHAGSAEPLRAAVSLITWFCRFYFWSPTAAANARSYGSVRRNSLFFRARYRYIMKNMWIHIMPLFESSAHVTRQCQFLLVLALSQEVGDQHIGDQAGGYT